MERRSFFERYRPTNLTADPLPLKVLNHSIWKAEMLGHALDWASQYLHQKNCPSYLISPLLGKVLKEMSIADLSECIAKTVGGRNADEVDADIVENIKYQPLRLMQSVTSKVDGICLRYKEENDQIETDFPNQTLQDGLAPQVYGASYYTMKNTRRTLEDRMVILPEIEKIFNFKTRASYFAVFDGHNGVEAAAYSAAHLHHHLVSSPDFPSDLSAAINYAFEATDTALLMKCKDEHIRSGTTAVIALIVPGNIYVAWAGDSQAVLVQNSQPVSLVSPHKPDREDEMRRIKGVGGEVISVSGTWRVNGNLAVSRAIGNLDYKEYVTSTPEISHIQVNGSEEFLILACDGLWDVVSPQRSVEILQDSLLSDNPSDIDSVSQKLVIEAKQSGSGDNITVIVVLLKPKEELRKLYTAIKMNGLAEAETPVEVAAEVVPVEVAPVEVVPVEIIPVEVASPVSPIKSVPKSLTPSASSKTSLSASPGKSSSATRATAPATNRNSVGMRSPSAQKAPVKLAERRTVSATKAPLPPVKTTTSATKTTVQKDGVGGATKPLTQKGTTGATSKTQLAARPATSTTKKPLKPEETDKPASTRTVVPPRPRPGTAPISSRLTTAKAPSKQDATKVGDESATGVGKESVTTKRSVLNSARSTASKEGVSSRVTQPRPATSAAPKPRVPSAASARPASAATTAPKPATTAAAPKAGVTRAAPTKPPSATSTTSRPPLKKPVGPSATKKDTKVNGQTALAPKSSDKKITKKEVGATKVNGVGKLGDISKVVNGVQKPEVEEKITVAEKVKEVDASVSEEKRQLEDSVEHVTNGIEKVSDVEIATEAKVNTVEVTNENNELESEMEKGDQGKVINGDIAYEDLIVTKPYAVDVAENVTVDQVKHDDNIKSELEEIEKVEKSVAQLTESEAVFASDVHVSEAEKIPEEVLEATASVDELKENFDAPENLIEQSSPVPPVVDAVVPEVAGVVEESNHLVVGADSISAEEQEPCELLEESSVDKDSGLKNEDLISDHAQETGCLKENEEVTMEDVNENSKQLAVPKEETAADIEDTDSHQDHESLVVHDIPEELNILTQQEQQPPILDCFDPVPEVPESSAFPDTKVEDHTEGQGEHESYPSDDVPTFTDSFTKNPFADSYSEPEPKENILSVEAIEEFKREVEQEKEAVVDLLDSGEEQINLAEPSRIESEKVDVPSSTLPQEAEPFESTNPIHDTADLEFRIGSHEQPFVEDFEFTRSALETHADNSSFNTGADVTIIESDNLQVLDTSNIRSDDFLENEKLTAIDPTSELQLETGKIEEILDNSNKSDVLDFEYHPNYSGLQQGNEESAQQEDIVQLTTKETMDDPFVVNTEFATADVQRGSPDLDYTNTEFDKDNFASQFEKQAEPVCSAVPDFGLTQEEFTTSQIQEEPQSQQGFDQFLTGNDLLGGEPKFGNQELAEGVTSFKEQGDLDYVEEKDVFSEQQKPRHDNIFEDLDFSKMDVPPHETVILGNSNPFLIDTPVTLSKGNANLEQNNKNEMDVGFGFGNDNGIGSELHSTSGGCVDTLLDINSANYPGSDTEIMYHQTSSTDGGNHTGNRVDTVGNEDNDALAILNR